MSRSVAPVNRSRRFASACVALGMIGAGLTGCALLEGPTPVTPERDVVAAPEVAPEFVPGGTSEENLPFFRELLRDYAAGTGPVQGQPIVDAVTAGGFDRAVMQVSFDESKTGLAADNIFVSVRTDASCLIGQVVAEDRSVTAVVEPAVGPADDLCLIGATRAIDW